MLLEGTTPIQTTACVSPIKLPSSGSRVADGTACWISGYGSTQGYNPGQNVPGVAPDKNQEAQVAIINDAQCKQAVEAIEAVTVVPDTMICAHGQSQDGKITDGCQGDSGGPLVCEQNGEFVVHGVTSWGL